MEYSLHAYRTILDRAVESGRSFVPFDAEGPLPPRRVHLRHDVDFSMEMAVELARVNAAAGVAGTFFVLLRGGPYNLLSRRALDAAREIDALGQRLGLHAVYDPAAGEAWEERLGADYRMALGELPMLSPVFTWHNPTPDLLEHAARVERPAGLVSGYASRFVRDIAYYSDSNMRNGADDFLRFVGEGGPEALQLLFHPLNWVAGGRTMADVFSGTWLRLIAATEAEMLGNAWYRRHCGEGVAGEVAPAFAAAWRGLLAREDA